MRKLFLTILIISLCPYVYADSEDTFSGQSGAGHIIQKDSVKYRQRPFLNFTGNLIDVDDLAGKTVVSVDTVSLDTVITDTSGWQRVGTDVILKNIGDNVGIGTATPSAELEVVGDIVASGTAVETPIFRFTGTETGWGQILNGAEMSLYTNGTEVCTFMLSGNRLGACDMDWDLTQSGTLYDLIAGYGLFKQPPTGRTPTTSTLVVNPASASGNSMLALFGVNDVAKWWADEDGDSGQSGSIFLEDGKKIDWDSAVAYIEHDSNLNIYSSDGISMTGALDMNNNIITNIGNANTDFQSDGGLNLAGDLIIAAGGANITGNSIFNNDLDVTGALDVGSLHVMGGTNFDDPIESNIIVEGSADFEETVTVGTDGQGNDVQFFGDTAGKYMLWDESADQLIVNGTVDLTGAITAENFISDIATGTSPYAATSTTLNTNLNADMVDSKHVGTSGSAIPLLDGSNTWTGTYNFYDEGADIELVKQHSVFGGGNDPAKIVWVASAAGGAELGSLKYYTDSFGADEIRMESSSDVKISANSGAGEIKLDGSVGFAANIPLGFGRSIAGDLFQIEYIAGTPKTITFDGFDLGLGRILQRVLWNSQSIDTDHVIESDDDASMFYLDGNNNTITVGGNLSTGKFNVSGTGFINDKLIFTQTDGNEYIDSLADGYMDYRATTAHRFGDGTNEARFASDGELTLAGTARVKKEFSLLLTDFNPGASGPTMALHDIYPTYEFSIDDDMHTSFELPTDWAVGTDITIEVYWAIDEALGTDESVQWSADWRAVAVGEVISAGASGNADFGDVVIPAVANTVVKTEATISGASLGADDLIAFNGSRIDLDNGATNDPTAEPYIIAVRLEYIADKLGEPT